MLSLINIKKQYRTGALVQQVLNGVSLNLRDNEFVSILGPSGSGKTTLLNIIGGLDVYDEGDLIINHVSTKNYKDRDWDSYRAHTIGFVFQSYNLIPHQTILKNVELALTISGLTKRQRKGKALEALTEVGLAEHAHKKPNQLSGGQMQRVAIARALVNNPDILLADEPTGALDSETSIQVLELLKKVAKDRLVVMVTHNPELAERYSTRIVQLKDGQIISDSDPFYDEPDAEKVTGRNLGKAGMGLLTAMQLSFNNLWTKKTRTLLVAFAGSIGIIGIALIIALSNGANAYIRGVEEKTLSEYPLSITKSSVDLSSMIDTDSEETSVSREFEDGRIYEMPLISSLYGTVQENDLRSLKEYLDSGKGNIENSVRAIEYVYSITPYIYRIDGNTARQVSPDSIMTSTGLESFSQMFGTSTYSSVFNPLPEDRSLYMDSYELVAGHWPEDDHDLVLVLSGRNMLSDLTLYHLGLKNSDNLDKMLETYQSGSIQQIELEEASSWLAEDILGTEFKLVHASSIYAYDPEVGMWIAQTGSAKQVLELAKQGETLVVNGIIRHTGDDSSAILTPGIAYPSALTYHIMSTAAKSEIVKEQRQKPDVNVFTGKRFDEEAGEFDLASLFEIDEDAVHELFKFDAADIAADSSAFENMDFDLGTTDLGSMIDTTSLSGIFNDLSANGIDRAFEGVAVDISTEKMTALFQQLYDGFSVYASGDPRTDITSLPDALRTYFTTEEALSILRSALNERISGSAAALLESEEFRAAFVSLLTGYFNFVSSGELTEEELANSVILYLETEEAAAIRAELVRISSEIINSSVTADEFLQSVYSQLTDSYDVYADQNNLPVPQEIASAFTNYMNSDSARAILKSAASDMIDMQRLQSNLNGIAAEVGGQIGSLLSGQIVSAMTQIGTQIAGQIQSAITTMMSGYMDNLSSGFNLSMDSLEDLVSVNMTAESMKEMLAELYSDSKLSVKKNLKTLGYADPRDPETITFYPLDFESKNNVIRMLDEYNREMSDAGDTDKVINFSDTVGSLMSSVTKIIDIIGYVLIAFVAISLIVSSIMIGVITYISVLERRKEIGILRAMGASKRNITQVFNSETIITGFLAGLIGILLTVLILIPGNAILQHVTKQPVRAFLPESSALLLIALSVILTTIGGLIPSKGAARQDPVVALRSE